MIPHWVPYVLTFSQAIYLAGALPRPQAHGFHGPDSDPPCAETGSDSLEVIGLISASSSNTFSGQQTASGSSSYSDSNTSTYTSAITIVQPNRPATVVISTALSSTQVPTTTSASQNLPDTTGVRASVDEGEAVTNTASECSDNFGDWGKSYVTALRDQYTECQLLNVGAYEHVWADSQLDISDNHIYSDDHGTVDNLRNHRRNLHSHQYSSRINIDDIKRWLRGNYHWNGPDRYNHSCINHVNWHDSYHINNNWLSDHNPNVSS